MAAMAVVALSSQACATTAQPPPVAPAVATRQVTGEGEMGLGLSGPTMPTALKAITSAPYGLAAAPDCGALAREVAEIDRLLGPDVDVPVASDRDKMIGRAFGSAMRGAIPYRWAVRWMTGAGRKDREMRNAILAATARRGYLKGVRLGLACPPPAA
jgi:hypothetical protein